MTSLRHCLAFMLQCSLSNLASDREETDNSPIRERSSSHGVLTLAAAAKVIAQNEAKIRKFPEAP